MLAVTALLVDPAQAHELVEEVDETQLPLILSELLLFGFWLTYCIGALRVPPATDRWLLFHGVSLFAALITIGPLDGWMENGATTHMIQHMLIMVVIAPFFVLARPLPQWVAANGRKGFWLWKPLLRLGRYPIWTGGLQAIVIWFWHAPKFYNLALASPWWHFAEHVSFMLGASVFWWSVLDRHSALALPALLFTLMHTGMLGALLSFAQRPLYGDLLDLHDQQMAGLTMWVPGGLPYLIAGCWCGLRWFQKNVQL